MSPSRMNKKHRLLIVCACAAALLLLLAYAAWPLLAEDAYVKRGTLAYYLTIHSPTIKNFPRIKKVGEEEFYNSNGDGPKLPANGLVYLSQERPEVLMESFDSYLTGEGFRKDVKQCGDSQCLYTGKASSIELTLTPKAGGSQQVSCTEYFMTER